MIGLLYRFLVGWFGCRHRWDTINQIVSQAPSQPIELPRQQVHDSEVPMIIPEISIDRVTYVLRCTLCGNMKNHEVRP